MIMINVFGILLSSPAFCKLHISIFLRFNKLSGKKVECLKMFLILMLYFSKGIEITKKPHHEH